MCFPPFCEPARHFLGCLTLRSGAVVVLVANGLYGLAIIVVHAVLLGDAPPEDALTSTGASESRLLMASNPKDPSHTWFFELLDLDVSFGHRLLGFDDWSCLTSGLTYGVIIVALSAYMVNAVLSGGRNLPMTSRWFVAFMNFEIVLYMGLVLAKGPKLCHIQELWLPRLEMDCGLLHFLYFQRTFIYLVIAGFGCWVFASFTYLLSFGFQAIDLPQYADHMEVNDQIQGVSQTSASITPGTQSQRQVTSYSTGGLQRQSYAPRLSIAPRGQATQSTLGLAPPRSQQMLAPLDSKPRTSYTIPRASSSMVSSSTTQSQHPLIRPPVAVF